MTVETLFGSLVPVDLRPEGTMSRGQRLTARQHADIEAGKHPLTGEPLPSPSPGTCGECAFRYQQHGGSRYYPKCDRPGVPNSHSASSDVRAFWPACPKFVALSSLSEEQRTRLDCGESPSVVIR